MCFCWLFEENIPFLKKNPQKLYYIQYIYTLVVGNTRYGKRHITRTEPVLLQAQHIRSKLTFTPILLFTCQIGSMHSSTRKTPQKRTLKIPLRHLLVNLKKVRVLAAPTLFSIELWRQWCVCESTFLEIYFFINCPEGNICGKFLNKRQTCTSSKVGFDQKLR